MSHRALVGYLPALLLFVVALGVRLGQHHTALLYPDGYQYLLMARGISEHLQPTTVLGPGGEAFTPNADAAMKPFFPLLVAAVHALGVSWLEAARIVTVTASAVAVTALALVVAKTSGSRLAGLAAGVLFLAAPSVGFWSGFSGPDPVAEALVLTAALAFVHHWPRAGGILTGLAIATRPEIAVVALAAALVSLRRPTARRELARAAPASGRHGSARVPGAANAIRSPGLAARVAIAALARGSLASRVDSPVVHALRRRRRRGGRRLRTRSRRPGHERSGTPTGRYSSSAPECDDLASRGTRNHDRNACPWRRPPARGRLVLKNPSLDRYFSLLVPAAAFLAGIAPASIPPWARPAGSQHRARGARRVHASRSRKPRLRRLCDRCTAGCAHAECRSRRRFSRPHRTHTASGSRHTPYGECDPEPAAQCCSTQRNARTRRALPRRGRFSRACPTRSRSRERTGKSTPIPRSSSPGKSSLERVWRTSREKRTSARVAGKGADIARRSGRPFVAATSTASTASSASSGPSSTATRSPTARRRGRVARCRSLRERSLRSRSSPRSSARRSCSRPRRAVRSCSATGGGASGFPRSTAQASSTGGRTRSGTRRSAAGSPRAFRSST